MAEYEVVREVQNLCANNQMRDVFFDEIETDGSMTIYVESAGVSQKFLFTPV